MNMALYGFIRVVRRSKRTGSVATLSRAAVGLLACLSFVAGGSGDARAQYLVVSAGESAVAGLRTEEGSGTLWRAYSAETYLPQLILLQLRELSSAALNFAANQDDFLPETASLLFTDGWVDDAWLFHNPGDADPVPTTISNDVPNAKDSALISFDFPGAGRHQSLNSELMFIDNTSANNAGLGRFAAFIDGHVEFLPASPHTFSDLTVRLRPDSAGTIYRGDVFDQQPFELPTPPDAVAVATAAPHHVQLVAESSVTNEVLSVFDTEGWGDFNLFGVSASANLYLDDARIDGPAADTVAVTVYAHIFATLTAPVPSAGFPAVHVQFAGSSDLGDPRDSAFLVLAGALGPYTTPNFVITELTPITDGEDDFVPGTDGVRIRAITQLSIEIPVGVTGRVFLLRMAAISHQELQNATPPLFGRARADIRIPATSSVDQVKLFLPKGYDLSVSGPDGPADLIRSVRRGDSNVDGQIDNVDAAAFAIAYTAPLVGNRHQPTSFDELATFDFDGDADVDCVDHDALTAVSDSALSAFAPCVGDDDGDAIANGDDDCPDSLPGAVVDDRGCLLGDHDADGRIGSSDWAAIAECLSRPAHLPSCRNSFDRDGDGVVWLWDVAAFLNDFTGN